jgi:hypothetical protein
MIVELEKACHILLGDATKLNHDDPTVHEYLVSSVDIDVLRDALEAVEKAKYNALSHLRRDRWIQIPHLAVELELLHAEGFTVRRQCTGGFEYRLPYPGE